MERGRAKTYRVAWVLVCISLAVIGSYVDRHGLDRIAAQLVRLSLTIGLAWALARGRGWARILTVGLAGIAAVGMVVAAIMAPGGWGTFTGACYALSYGIVVMRLAFDQDVRAYFEAMDSSRHEA